MADALDRRRRRWVPIDVDLLSGDGRDVHDRFGPMGVLAWIGFLTACAKATERGRMTWRTEEEAKVLMGLHTYELVDNQGQPFTIAEFFRWTGQRGWSTTTRKRPRTDPRMTAPTRWDDWQPRAHRATSERTDPQINSHKKGADRAQKGRKKGAEGAQEGRAPYQTIPSTSPKERGGGGEGTARESESADSTPAGSADSTSREPATPKNNGPQVPAEASAAIAALRAATGRPPTTRPATAGEAGS